MKLSRGCFIVFEGIDRCGKTTQTKRLQQHLKDHVLAQEHGVHLMQFPNRKTETGKIINDYLQNKIELDDAEIHHLFASNRREDESTIRRLLNEGHTVIVDRYAYSGVCFSAAKKISKSAPSTTATPSKGEIASSSTSTAADEDQSPSKRICSAADGEPEILSIEWCKIPDKGLPAPDLVVFLDLTVEQSKLRGDFGAERYEKEEFQKRVRENFLSLVGPNWKIINAARSMEEVEKDVAKAAMHALAALDSTNGKPPPIKELW